MCIRISSSEICIYVTTAEINGYEMCILVFLSLIYKLQPITSFLHTPYS